MAIMEKVQQTKAQKTRQERKEQGKALLVAPHNAHSRPVGAKDLKRVIKDSEKMKGLLHEVIGIWDGGLAIAHSQITTKNPLRFFVTKEGDVCINPKIVKHSGYTNEHKEGCLTFHETQHGRYNVQRWQKCEVEFQLLEDGKLSEVYRENFTGLDAKIFQHEIDHFDCKYINGLQFNTKGKRIDQKIETVVQ